MTAITGKWKLINAHNLEAYHTAINTSEEYKNKLRQIAAERKTNPDYYLEEYYYDITDGTIRKTILVNGEKTREVKYKIGLDQDGHTADGRPFKVKLGLVGNNKIIINEKGTGFEIDGFIEVKGNELTQSLTGNGVNSLSTYTRIG